MSSSITKEIFSEAGAFASGSSFPDVLETSRPKDQANTTIGSPGPYLLMSGYDAANQSPGRGYLYWPTLDSRHEMSPLAANEIKRRIHWLYANFGFARRLVNGMSKMIGFLTPQPTTPDEDWNELAFNNFTSRAGRPLIFDRAGKFDFFTAQLQLNRNRFKDGDCLQVRSTTPSGGARFVFYDSYQIASQTHDSEQQRVFDGVELDRFGRHRAYFLRDPEKPEQFRRVASRNALYYGNFETHNQVRGLSILAHAVTNMIDVVETRGFTKHGIKAASRMGTIVERSQPNVAAGPGGIGGPMIQQQVTTAEGDQKNINWELVFSGAVTPRLNPGESVKVVTDDRPHPNRAEFEKALLRDCTWGVDLPYEALCEIAGVTGPGIRYVMAEIKRWILMEHHRLALWDQSVYAYHIAREIESGRLPRTPHPYWNQVTWIGLPDMTIDRGQEAKSTVVRLDSGLSTWADEWAGAGEFWKKPIRKQIYAVAWAKKQVLEASEKEGVDLTLGEVLPHYAAKSAPAAAQEIQREEIVEEAAEQSRREREEETEETAQENAVAQTF